MTTLQEEIKKAIPDYETAEFTYANEYWDLVAKAAAEVAKKWIEKALSDAFNQAHYSELHPDVVKRMEYNEWAKKWLKDNGIEQ